MLLISSEVQGQIPAPPAGQPTAQGLSKLTGDDAKREHELDKAIAAALEADRWDEAIGRAEDLGPWTNDDSALAGRVRTALRERPGPGPVDLRSLLAQLRVQRLDPLAKAMAANAPGRPPVRRLIVLPSRPWQASPSRHSSRRTTTGL